MSEPPRDGAGGNNHHCGFCGKGGSKSCQTKCGNIPCLENKSHGSYNGFHNKDGCPRCVEAAKKEARRNDKEDDDKEQKEKKGTEKKATKKKKTGKGGKKGKA